VSDGFTLNDLVSYNAKHNEANGEGNRDGSDDNLSWNCGIEGDTEDPIVERLRRQIKNLLALTLLAAGTPMLLAGDEVRRTQRGNNNAYCQDNETSWFDWELITRYADVYRFTQQLIALRRDRELSPERLEMTLEQILRRQPVHWHGVKLDRPDWSDHSHTVAVTFRRLGDGFALHAMLNAYWDGLDFEIPPPNPGYDPWRLCIDTSREAPDDIRRNLDGMQVDGPLYHVEARSVVLLIGRVVYEPIGAAQGAPRAHCRANKPIQQVQIGLKLLR